ncbi:DUF5593 domain-containing protein [Nocardia terpenica]|uniref:GAF domain-containing protein n=1 Tax=Nocardia terpenica TaxID=455432 RepID=UPI001895BD19|nr:GAF domain-containing protein [Nocardia terpenica]MBF6064675.1 DUF5593 domain-containing protein [Nocardia terpenica]MBF6107191.1 DUF5593 domain-containing protein [Nocardia terpenica]MBF6114949.1 DUF5593 domain-containing protein [Nocardia terpenica]MBF6122054.1 DUF5593 domain-containing protein [Nocardia terpenica]MBF6154437.1 DUF5593 domain-containing protein [Nocardia terpenica]
MGIAHSAHVLSIPWIMVETLDPAVTPTVVSGGDGGRDFTNAHRAIERAINSMQLGAAATPDDLYEHIISSRDRGESVDMPLGKNKRQFAFRARPVFGPKSRVHGVQYWLGPADQDPPEPPPATGVVWDLPAKLVHLTIDCTRMAGIPDAKFVPDLPLAMFWHYANRFDHHEEVYNLLYNPRSQARLRTEGTVRNIDHRRDMHWQATIRTRFDGGTIGAWGLLEDLTCMTSQPPKATLEQTAFREYLRAEQTYLAVIHLPDSSVIRWLTDPPPWIDCTRAPDQVFPSEDRARLARAIAPYEGIVRAINRDNGYTPTKIVLLPYRGRRRGPFAIGRFLRADTHIAHTECHMECDRKLDHPDSCK